MDVLDGSGEVGVAVRAVAADESATIDTIAERMRLTLAEVLGSEQAEAMFSRPELVERVHWHLDRTEPGRRAGVFAAEDRAGAIVGHTMVRVESNPDVAPEPVGLFATTYVDPRCRRSGVAAALLEAGERWMVAEGMTTALTYTDPANAPLIALYARHGYTWEQIDETWARASRNIS